MSQKKTTPEAAAPPADAKAAPVSGPEAPAFSLPDDSSAYALAERVCWHILEKRGDDIVVLDLRGRSDVCDFFVVATAASDVQVRAVAKHVQDRLLAAGQKDRGAVGLGEGRWALLDYFDVVVHVFQTRARDYFQLERLWGDSGRLDIGPEWFSDAEVAGRHPDLKFVTGVD